jgi:hypothetical protein
MNYLKQCTKIRNIFNEKIINNETYSIDFPECNITRGL